MKGEGHSAKKGDDTVQKKGMAQCQERGWHSAKKGDGTVPRKGTNVCKFTSEYEKS